MKPLRSSTANRKPARTLPRVVPAGATILPVALPGSPSVGGARQPTMPLASAPQVALSRLTRIVLPVAVALCLGAPTAGADAVKKLDNNLAKLWTTILQTPSAQNSFGSGGAAFACWDLGGTVAPFAPRPGFNGTCTVKPSTKIFVAAASAECSTLPGDDHPTSTPPPWTEAQLGDCARALDVQVAPIVEVDDKSVPVTEVTTGLLNIKLPADNILGPGAPAKTKGQSVGHGWVTLLDRLTPGTHRIDIDTITTTIVVV